MNGGKVGKNCCLYPSGADPFMPEPDLVTIGKGTVVDCASMVCHLNTRGNFELTPITIEQDCTLRTHSRVQAGVHMEAGSMLLEKSIAMTGEVLDEKSVWQGGPATLWFRTKELPTYIPPDLGEEKMVENSDEKEEKEDMVEMVALPNLCATKNGGSSDEEEEVVEMVPFPTSWELA